MSEEYGVALAKELMDYVDRDSRSLRQKLEDLEREDALRVATDEKDVLARVEEDARVREDVDFTEGVVVEVLVKVYGDSSAEHENAAITWWEPGPVMMDGENEHVERIEIE